MVTAFAKERQATQEKYDQKSVRLTGRVAEVKWDDDKRSVVFTLEDPADSGKPPGRIAVRCECDLNEKLRPKLEKVQAGQTITVLGECSASRFDTEINVRAGKLLKGK